MKEEKDGKKKQTLSGAVAAVTAFSLLLGGLFHSPADLLRRREDAAPPTSIVELLSPDTDSGDDGDGSEEPEERRGGLRARLRQALLRVPLGVRAAVGLPLWALGWVLWQGLGALWSGVLSPVAGTLLGWLGAAAALLGVLALALKAAFPRVPLKKLLNKRSLWILLLGACALAGADVALQLSTGETPELSELLRAFGSLLLLTAATLSALRARLKRG